MPNVVLVIIGFRPGFRPPLHARALVVLVPSPLHFESRHLAHFPGFLSFASRCASSSPGRLLFFTILWAQGRRPQSEVVETASSVQPGLGPERWLSWQRHCPYLPCREFRTWYPRNHFKASLESSLYSASPGSFGQRELEHQGVESRVAWGSIKPGGICREHSSVWPVCLGRTQRL